MTTAVACENRDRVVENVKRTISTDSKLKAFGEFSKLEWLPGDASNRFYGRLHFSKKSLILMVMNAPEAFKSEEVTGADAQILRELPFVTMDLAFEKANVRVPHIYYVAADSSFLVLEDFGDELLYLRRQKESAVSWYEVALKELAVIQKMDVHVTPHRFTKELLTWESEHFVEYALRKREKRMNEATLNELRSFLGRLVQKMVSSKYVLAHRDYHSKNLLILESEKQIGVIDFQDALQGPPTYDLASLLRDSYIRFDDQEEEHLLKYFEGVSKHNVDRELFGLTSLQRNLKAVGRFYYILMVKGRDTHIPFVKPSLLRIFKTLQQLKELKILSLMEGLLKDEAS